MRESDLNRLRELAGLDKVSEAPAFNPSGTVAGAGQSARPGAMPPTLNPAKPTIRRDAGDTGPSLLRQRLATTGPTTRPNNNPNSGAGGLPPAGPTTRPNNNPNNRAGGLPPAGPTTRPNNNPNRSTAPLPAGPTTRPNNNPANRTSPDARDARTMAATQRSASQALDRSTIGTNTRIAPGTTAGGPSLLKQRLASRGPTTRPNNNPNAQ